MVTVFTHWSCLFACQLPTVLYLLSVDSNEHNTNDCNSPANDASTRLWQGRWWRNCGSLDRRRWKRGATGGGGGGQTGPQALSTALITDAEMARTRVDNGQGDTEDLNLTPTQIQDTFQIRTIDADRLVASDAYVASSTTPSGADVSSDGGVTIDGDTIRVSLAEIQMGVVDRFNLTGFNSQYSPVMIMWESHLQNTVQQCSCLGLSLRFLEFCQPIT